MSGPDIFISYNREDAAIARLYADALADAGLTVWWDATLRSGEDYDAVTEKSLRTAKAVVVLWSPRSVNSRWVRAEATIADRGHTLAPVMIEACDRPVMFELKQTVELSHWRGDISDKAWLDFVADLRRKVGREAPDPVAEVATPIKPEPAKAAHISAGRSTVAVLPVGCRGGDGELELLAEDLTEDITRELAHDGRFRVIAAGSMAAWRGKPIDHKDVGRQLEARYLVEGKLQRSGKDTRLTAQLIDGNTGNVLWSTRLVADPGAADFSADTLPVAAAAQVTEQVIEREQNRAMAKRAPFLAWDHIFRSAASSQRGDPDSAGKAVDEARLAVAAAPDIGLAHAMLAAAIADLPESQGLRPDADQILEIQTRTRQAMRLDGNNPSVLIALAAAYKGLGEHEVSLRLARRTVELRPNSPASHLILGNSYRMLGRTADAAAAYRRQDELSPFDNGRNVALTYLGECLLLDGEPEAAEAALDRALMLDPEYPLALEWKAVAADQLGKQQAALGVMRQIRSAEAAMPLDQHAWQIERSEHLQSRAAAPVATLRRLWLEVEGVAPAAAANPDLAEVDLAATQSSEADPVAEDALAGSATATALLKTAAVAPVALLDPVAEPPAPVGPGPDPAPEPSAAQPAETSAIPLKAAKLPAAKRTRSKSRTGGSETPPEIEDPSPAAGDDYLIRQADQPAQPQGSQGKSANDDDREVFTRRRPALPRIAVLAGVFVAAGIGGAVWFGGSNGGSAGENAAAAPVAAVADLGLAIPGQAASVSAAVPQPLDQAMTALLAASRNARRPQAELAALETGRQGLTALLAQLAAKPADAALAAQLNGLAAGLAQQQGAALSGDADRWFSTQQQQAAVARRQLPAEGAATVDRALNKARGARADLGTAIANAKRAPDATRSLVLARAAVVAYSKMAAFPVAPAVASARSAEAETGKLQGRLSRSRTEIETARVEAGRLSGQVAGFAAIEKPGLFASTARRQSFKLRKDNAERARALGAEADRIAVQASSVNDLGTLQATLSRLQSLKGQLSDLAAASSAALKSGAEPEKKDAAAVKK